MQNPRQTLAFAADYFPVLEAIYRNIDGVTDGELNELVERYGGDQHKTSYAIAQLKDLGLISPFPGASSTWELPPPIRDFLDYLLRQHFLATPEEFHGILAAIQSMSDALDSALLRSDVNACHKELQEIDSKVEQLRQLAANNHEEITRQVLAAKSKTDGLSTRSRFEMISRLWQRYLKPMESFLDIDQAMHAALDRLDRISGSGQTHFLDDVPTAMKFNYTRARVVRMRRDFDLAFRESINEVLPLYESLRRDSALTAAVSRIMERLDREGIDSVPLDEIFSQCRWSVEDQLSTEALNTYFAGLAGYKPSTSMLDTLLEGSEQNMPVAINLVELKSSIRQSLPIADTFTWLQNRYPGFPADALLMAYAQVFADGELDKVFGSTEQTYPFGAGEIALLAHPMKLERTIEA